MLSYILRDYKLSLIFFSLYFIVYSSFVNDKKKEEDESSFTYRSISL